ncbi:hypothetical protein CROQUDRAFT_663198 [Cronartium quercuum f. sp. fusiforme G11]|uniref:Kinase n=1 Tax=Cronartium quercuum f. sp. fusiforme G11 TaxID=708437 RepID=A0A9P6N982_9BASI|nr:hypothetical protein CROQUDRAFT_663198 [Cronartium quercuum f. sp. fusiforme G11]
MAPDDKKSHSLQAGGHPDIVQIDPDDQTKIFKQACPREVDFYENFADRLDSTKAPASWSGWRPAFYGRRIVDGTHTDGTFIVLQNLVPTLIDSASTVGFRHPNILDIKLGKQLYDDDASEEKVARMKQAAADTTSAHFGIRLTGGKVWNNQTQEYETLPKAFGKSLDPLGSNLDAGFSRFFPIAAPAGKSLQETRYSKQLTISSGGISPGLMRKLLEQVLLPQFNRLSSYVSGLEWRVYGSSLLVVYEGDNDALERAFEDGSVSNGPSVGVVKMIDFAHTWEAQGSDTGLLAGFQTTSNLLQGLLDAISKFEEST